MKIDTSALDAMGISIRGELNILPPILPNDPDGIAGSTSLAVEVIQAALGSVPVASWPAVAENLPDEFLEAAFHAYLSPDVAFERSTAAEFQPGAAKAQAVLWALRYHEAGKSGAHLTFLGLRRRFMSSAAWEFSDWQPADPSTGIMRGYYEHRELDHDRSDPWVVHAWACLGNDQQKELLDLAEAEHIDAEREP